MLQTADGVPRRRIDLGGGVADVDGAAARSAAGPPGRLLPVGPDVAVVAVEGGAGDGLARFAVRVELRVARPEGLLSEYEL